MPLAIGVEVQRAKLFLNGHTISGAEIGVACVEKCKIYGPGTITGNVEGIETVSSKPNGGVVMVSDATVSGNDAVGIAGDKVKIIGSTLDNNGGLVVEGHVVGGGIVATGQVTVRSSTIGGNLTHGVCTPERIRLVKSIVQANGTAPGCEPNASCAACGDLVSDTRPIVNPKSTCDTSVHPPTDTWGVCSTD
jgi:hypothetical protein